MDPLHNQPCGVNMAQATPIIACTYAEIALKGRNRKVFLRKLINNITIALKGEPLEAVRHVESRLMVHLTDPGRALEVTRKLKNVFGLQWMSPVVSVPRDQIDDELLEDLEADREPRLTEICKVATELSAENRGTADLVDGLLQYSPSITELAIVAGAISGCLLVYTLAERYLPLDSTEH